MSDKNNNVSFVTDKNNNVSFVTDKNNNVSFVTDKNNNVSFECLIKTIMSVLNVLTDIITSITAHTIGFAFFLP
jgi:hypothetical protein